MDRFTIKKLLDDLEEDPVALSYSVSYLYSPKNRVKDFASTQFSWQEFPLGVSLGKEFGYSNESFYRWWLEGAGIYTVTGSPVITAAASFEKVFSPSFSCLLFADFAKGYGKDEIPSHFHSWSQVAFHKTDLGAILRYTKASFYIVEVCYKRALSTKLYPTARHAFSFLLSFPFSFV